MIARETERSEAELLYELRRTLAEPGAKFAIGERADALWSAYLDLAGAGNPIPVFFRRVHDGD